MFERGTTPDQMMLSRSRQRSSSAPGLLLERQHAPQALPQSERGLRGAECLREPTLACIGSAVDIATYSELPDIEEPVLQVGEWVFHGDMTVLYDGSRCLSNSTVKMGNAMPCGRRPTVGEGEPTLVAVKSVNKKDDAESVAMLRREIDILSELGDSHCNILPLLYGAELPFELVLLTRYAPGGDLSGYMPRNVPVVESEVRRLSLQMLNGLRHLHRRRIVHGDIKPENVFLVEADGGMLLRLSDFGLSRKVPEGERFVQLPGVQGSYGYIPAEIIESGRLYFEADVFAHGVMIFRYLGGYDPFYPPSKVKDPVEFDESTWEDLSPAAAEYVTQLLSTDPEVRGSADHLLTSHRWLQENVVDCKGGMRSANVHFLDQEAAHDLWMKS